MMTTDVYPGKDLGTLELTITDEMVQRRPSAARWLR